MTASLSTLTVGALTLSPAFDPAVLNYTAETSNASNKVMAEAANGKADVVIKMGEDEKANGSSVTWATGENVLTVTVTNGTTVRTYTVTVTKA